jgi:hypothetical protein
VAVFGLSSRHLSNDVYACGSSGLRLCRSACHGGEPSEYQAREFRAQTHSESRLLIPFWSLEK